MKQYLPNPQPSKFATSGYVLARHRAIIAPSAKPSSRANCEDSARSFKVSAAVRQASVIPNARARSFLLLRIIDSPFLFERIAKAAERHEVAIPDSPALEQVGRNRRARLSRLVTDSGQVCSHIRME